MTEPTDAELWQLHMQMPGQHKDPIDFARAVLAKWGQPAHSGEPAAWLSPWRADQVTTDPDTYGKHGIALYTAPQPVEVEPLTPREIELIDGMIAVQLDHAMRCDAIANRAMADKQKGWDMERVALLQKFKAAHGVKGGQHGTD